MPNRIFRDGFLDSESIDSLSDFEECCYHRSVIAADDAGRIDGRSEMLKSRLFPLKDRLRARDVERAMASVVKAKLAIAYEYQGRKLYQLTKWQKCGKAVMSKYPWHDGGFSIKYVDIETKDGKKSFVFTSLIDPMATPYLPHAYGVTPKTNTETETETETKTHTETDVGARNRAPTPSRFQKPAPQDVTDYAASIGFALDGQKFCDHYEARGWKYKGGLSMKDWKAAVRTWKTHDTQKTNQGAKSGPFPGEEGWEPTDAEKIVVCWKKIRGIPATDKAWNREIFPKQVPHAERLLAYFDGNWEQAVDCIEWVSAKLTGKVSEWGWNAVFQHAADFKNGKVPT